MKRLNTCLGFHITVLFFCIQNLDAFVFNGFEIRDLVKTDASFALEASYWSASALRGTSMYSTCSGTYLLGGYDILGPKSGVYLGHYFQRIYTGLPLHSGLYFSMTFWAIDSWDAPNGDTFQIQFDSKLINGWVIPHSSFNQILCGQTKVKDLSSMKMFGTVLHNNSTLTLKIISHLDQAPTQESFGVRDINIAFVNASATFSEKMCGLAPITLPNNQCICPVNTFESPAGSSNCLPCNSSCSSCFGPSSSECYQCAAGYSFNGTDCISCDASCSVCFGPGANQCSLCNSGYFLIHNNTCIPTCNSPLIQTSDGNNRFCESPCGLNGFIGQNGSCLSSCNFPLNQTSQYGFNFCSSPCQNSTEFLYWNGSCQLSCNIPLIISVTNNITYCNHPCLNTSDYYYEEDGSCSSYCNPPNQTIAYNFYNSCSKVTELTMIEDQTIQNVVTATNAGNSAITMSSALASAIGSNSPGTFGLASFIKMLPYIRYLQINYPSKLQLLLDNMNGSVISFSFGPSIPSEVESLFIKHPLPGNFDKYNFHSSFIVNYWQNMGALGIILCVILILNITRLLAKKCETFKSIIEKLKPIVKWNFFMMIFCTNLDGIALSTSLEIRTLDLDYFLPNLSFLFCVVMNILTTLIFCLILYIILDIRKNKSRVPLEDKNHPYKKWQEFQSFYVGSKEDLLIQQIFILPYLLRMYVFNLIIAHLFDYPLLQTILIILLNFSLLIYMIKIKPFKSRLVFCQHLTDELILFTINFSILFLAILDALDKEAGNLREDLGGVIIICNIIINITANIYLIAYLYVGIKAAIIRMKREKKTGLISFIIALLAPFEAGGMDVEILPEKPQKIVPVSNASNVENKELNSKETSTLRILGPNFSNTFEESKQNNIELPTNLNLSDNLTSKRKTIQNNNDLLVLQDLIHAKFSRNSPIKSKIQIDMDDSESIPCTSKELNPELIELSNLQNHNSLMQLFGLRSQNWDHKKRSLQLTRPRKESSELMLSIRADSFTPKER